MPWPGRNLAHPEGAADGTTLVTNEEGSSPAWSSGRYHIPYCNDGPVSRRRLHQRPWCQGSSATVSPAKSATCKTPAILRSFQISSRRIGLSRQPAKRLISRLDTAAGQRFGDQLQHACAPPCCRPAPPACLSSVRSSAAIHGPSDSGRMFYILHVLGWFSSGAGRESWRLARAI